MEKLYFIQPPDSFKRDEYGELIVKACELGDDGTGKNCVGYDDAALEGFAGRNPLRYTRWTVYAWRSDRGGKEAIIADVMSGNWQTRFDIKRRAALNALNEDWHIIDVDGRTWDIETVNAGTQGGGRTMWHVYCTRRKAS